MILRKFILLLCLICVAGFNLKGQSTHQPAPQYYADYHQYVLISDSEITQRLNEMPGGLIPHEFSPALRSYIRTYTVKNRDRTERMLGRQHIFFPIIEKILAEQNAPNELKYISVIESALNPRAISRSGAGGLWQFMPATGKIYSLDINTYVDERADPYLSTEAAAKYLSHLYHKFGDWALAFAAYNAGPGRVNRAIRRAKSRKFNRVKKYLPRETRSYVPGFVAANYLFKYYHLHNLNPQYPTFNSHDVETMRVFNHTKFTEISAVTGLPMEAITLLNPTYVRDAIPSSRSGNLLVIPRHKVDEFHKLRPYSVPEFYYRQRALSGRPHTPHIKYVTPEPIMEKKQVKKKYKIKKGDSLGKIAQKHRCKVSDLKRWNNLKSSRIVAGKYLKVYKTEKVPIPSEPIIASSDYGVPAPPSYTDFYGRPPAPEPVVPVAVASAPPVPTRRYIPKVEQIDGIDPLGFVQEFRPPLTLMMEQPLPKQRKKRKFWKKILGRDL